MKLQYGLIFSVIAIFSTMIYLFVFKSTESRTKYPEWNQSTEDAWEPNNAAAAVAAGAVGSTAYNTARAAELWTTTSQGSNAKLTWAGTTDTKTTTQLDMTKNWINRTVAAGITANSITSSGTNGIKSILVRKNDGLTAELPIMEFFEKLHKDMMLGYQRAKEYADKVGTDILITHPGIVTRGQGIRLQLQNAPGWKLSDNGRGLAALHHSGPGGGQVWDVIW
jgi:hypothetical protein